MSRRLPWAHETRKAPIEDVLPLWRSGLTLSEVGDQLGVTGEMIRLRLNEYGFPPLGPKRALRFEREGRADAVKRASRKRGDNGYWSRERVIQAIQEFNDRYGQPPSARDWNTGMARANGRLDLVQRFYADACWPHTGTVLYVFKSFNAAISAAGFEPRKPGQRGPTSDYAREHLLPLSRAGGSSLRTHCKRGHEFTPENTIVTATQRMCRTCHRARRAEQYQRRKARRAVRVASRGAS